MKRHNHLLLLFVLASATAATSQEPSSPPADDKLQLAFVDDFGTDSRSDYQIEGEAWWEPGMLALAEGSSIARAINGGWWAKLELEVDWPELTQEKPQSELRVWFHQEGAAPCCVRLRRELMEGRQAGSAALIDSREQDGSTIENVVRQLPTRLDMTRVTMEFLHGMVTVSSGEQRLLDAHIDDGVATVKRIVVGSIKQNIGIKSINAFRNRPPNQQYSDEQERRLASNQEMKTKAYELYGQSKYSAAAQLLEQVLKTEKALLGEEHPEYAEGLNNVAECYRGIGAYARAEPLYKKAIQIQKAVLGERHPEYANTLNNLAVMYCDISDFRRAEPLYEQSRDIRKLVLGEDHPEYALSLFCLADLYSRVGDHARAEPLYVRSKEIWKSALGEKHPFYAASLNGLANLYRRIGDFARAEPIYKEATEIRKSILGDQHPDYATSLVNLAGLYAEIGDYAHAESLFKDAMQILRSVLGEKHPRYANSLNHLGELYRRMGDYARAEPLFMQSKEINKSALGENHPFYAASLNHLAAIYTGMDDYPRAEPLFLQALQIRKSVLGEKNEYYAESLNNLASLYSRMGDYAHAEPLHVQAMEIQKSALGEKHPRYATSLNNLATLYVKIGDHARAGPLLMQSMEIRKSVLGEKHPRYASSLHNVASWYEHVGDYVRAERLHKESAEIRKSVLGETHPSYTLSLGQLAKLRFRMGDYTRAESLYKQTIEIQKSVLGTQHTDYATSLANLAGLYESMGDTARAQPVFIEASTIARMNLDSNSLIQSQRQQRQNQSEQRLYLDPQLANSLHDRDRPQDLLETVWRWKGAVTLRQQAYRAVAANPKLAPLFKSLQSVSRQLSVASAQMPVPPPKAAGQVQQKNYQLKRDLWEQRFAALNQQREELEQQIAAESEAFREVQQPLSVASVQNLLPAGAAFVEFLEYVHPTPDPDKKGQFVRERRYIAFVVTKDREPVMIGLGSADSLAQQINTFRRPFVSGQEAPVNREAAALAGRQLREQLWAPIEQHLGGMDTVIVSPDTALGTLPLAALPGRQPDSFLLEDYRLASIPFANLLPRLMRQEALAPDDRGLLVLGDVDYDADLNSESETAAPVLLALASEQGRFTRTRGEKESGWTSLPGFGQELEIVRSLHQQRFGSGLPVTTLSGSGATEDALLKQAANHRTLHLITHGYFEDASVKSIDQAEIDRDLLETSSKGPDPFISTWMPGLLAGLVLAGANRPTDDPSELNDGILRASEIEASSLPGVELVVLSACETGLGKVAGGEGLTGLQRAFQIAGARSVVASLWKVEDRATQELMRRFYTNLWQKQMSKIDALREAQLWMLNHPEELAKMGVKNPKTRGDVRKLRPKADKPADDLERTNPYFWAAFQVSGDWR